MFKASSYIWEENAKIERKMCSAEIVKNFRPTKITLSPQFFML